MAATKPRLSKLGTLLDKMLDQADSWELHPHAGHHRLILYKNTGHTLELKDKTIDFMMPCLTEYDNEILYPKGAEIYKQLTNGTKKSADKRESSRRSKFRTETYRSIMRSIMGVDRE